MELLKTVDEWSFDIFALAEVTDGRPLFHLGMALFEAYDIALVLPVDPLVMGQFLTLIEDSYKKNPYHNSTHAADVLHSLHYFLKMLKLGDILTTKDVFASIIAASMHDVDHPGFNNAYMIATGSQQAIRYNDISVLENYHCSYGWDILIHSKLFDNIPLDKQRELRTTITSMVLATDMANHFEYVAKFKSKVAGTGVDFADAKDRQIVLDFAIKCGDINNASKETSICVKWAMLIMQEFYNQVLTS